ncbi:HAD-IA family hydrolase [Streptomyces sp. KM77-8]|uniref:HAD-IA family hydrolase n=1 Tax=Streptomyces haneummycinicus TaxID=3074435 RepID=A0AAT9HXS8_9ACTN
MGTHTAAHIVWDWNGTLFHDVDAVIGATNAAFAELGLEPLTLERYRELYCVPVPKFYERLMGRLPSAAEWELMDATFHRHYTEHHVRCGLAEGVTELLAEWDSAGRSQSILSLYGHAELVPLVRGSGSRPTSCGWTGGRGRPGWQGGAHGAAPRGADRGRSGAHGGDRGRGGRRGGGVAGGGAGCAVHRGSHGRASLEAVGVPVVDTLREAVGVAERVAAA